MAVQPPPSAIDLLSDVSDEIDLTQLAKGRLPAVVSNSLESSNEISLRTGAVRPALESFPAVPGLALSPAAARLPPTLMAVAAVPGLPILEGDALR